MLEPGQALCQGCEPAGELLHHDPGVRLRALREAGVGDRPRVLRAFLRGGGLYEGVEVEGVDLGEALVGWLVTHHAPTLFLRWLAEDAVWGGFAWKALAARDLERVLQRAPVWLLGQRPAAEHARVLAEVWRLHPGRWSALGVRLGSATGQPRLPPHLVNALPWYARPGLAVGMQLAPHRPTEGAWVPDAAQIEAARRWRRWPLHPTPTGVLVCTLCAEPLQDTSSPCTWCGTGPDDEPPTEHDLNEVFVQRHCCETCGLDQTRLAHPILCGGCGAPVSERV